MGLLFKNNDFKTDYKKRPFDGYKATLDKLDEETKKKLDRQRTIGMACIVGVVVLLVLVLYVTGIGVDKTQSVSGNVFVDKESVLIECFGDSLTEGSTDFSKDSIASVTYPKELEAKLPGLFADDGREYKFRNLTVKNYGQAATILQETSCSRLSGTADIVLILYTLNNFLDGGEYVGTLEANIDTIQKAGSQVFLLNYPLASGSSFEDKISQANNYISSTAKALNVELIDLQSYFSSLQDHDPEEIFSGDGVHLTEEGYILMGDYIADVLHEYYFEMD